MPAMTTTLRDALKLLAANWSAVSAHIHFGKELLRHLQDTTDASLEEDTAALASRWRAHDGVPPKLRHLSRAVAADLRRAIRRAAAPEASPNGRPRRPRRTLTR